MNWCQRISNRVGKKSVSSLVAYLHHEAANIVSRGVYILWFVRRNDILLQRGIGSISPYRLPSLGVSSLDLGRSDFSDGPFFN